MRADRLVALLLLLQRRGQVTTAQAAAELGVSVSTARRDFEALSTVGIPVYPQSGRGGGWRLLGDHRTDLSGLTGPEVRALFVAAGSAPEPPDEVRQALRKLGDVVPEPFRSDADAAIQAVFVDIGSVVPAEARTPDLLTECRDVVIAGCQALLRYTDMAGKTSERMIHPLGLVVRRGRWYLITDTEHGRRMFRVDRMIRLERVDAPAQRPDGFDLAATWAEMTSGRWDDDPQAPVIAHARSWVVQAMKYRPGLHLVSVGAADADGWSLIELHDGDMVMMAAKLAGFGESLRVLEPATLRRELWKIGRYFTTTYSDETGDVTEGVSDGNDIVDCVAR